MFDLFDISIVNYFPHQSPRDSISIQITLLYRRTRSKKKPRLAVTRHDICQLVVRSHSVIALTDNTT
jgi:hypothetical protein